MTKKEMEADLLRQDRLSSLELLAKGLAHEIGTPLGVIRGRAELLAMHSEQELQKESLDIIISKTDQISKLIQSLLRFSRSTEDVRKETLNIHDVAVKTVILFEAILSQRMIELQNNLPKDLFVVADFNRLQHILYNLITNAIQALPKTIYLEAEVRENNNQDYAAVSVKDTGCGIAKDNMQKIFQPFFTTREVGHGTGLGLAIVSRLVQDLSGKIQAESAVGEGSSFTVFLPLKNKIVDRERS